MKRKVLNLLICLLIVFWSDSNLYADISQQEIAQDLINCVEACNIAEKHIKSVIALDDDSGWKSDTYISEKRVLFDTENEISAYYLKLKREDKDNGYIIVSAERNVNPIIEFSYEGDSFIDKALQQTKNALKNEDADKMSDSKIIYTGGLNYFIEYDTSKEEIIYDISSPNYNRVTKKYVKENKVKKKKIKSCGIQCIQEEVIRQIIIKIL